GGMAQAAKSVRTARAPSDEPSDLALRTARVAYHRLDRQRNGVSSGRAEENRRLRHLPRQAAPTVRADAYGRTVTVTRTRSCASFRADGGAIARRERHLAAAPCGAVDRPAAERHHNLEGRWGAIGAP